MFLRDFTRAIVKKVELDSFKFVTTILQNLLYCCFIIHFIVVVIYLRDANISLFVFCRWFLGTAHATVGRNIGKTEY